MAVGISGYDSNAIIEQAERQEIEPVIPSKKNRKEQQEYDKDHYKLRHLVEYPFLHLKLWRGIATQICQEYRIIPCSRKN